MDRRRRSAAVVSHLRESRPVPDLTALAHRLVDLARRAPSAHNTQPWSWCVQGDTLELWADRSRQLPVADPFGRNLMISCGCALHHTRVAARGLGLGAEVEVLPDAARPDLLARLTLGPGDRDPEAAALLEAMAERHTDRRRFTAWPVPEERLGRLAAVGSEAGAHVLPVVDVTSRHRIELLISRALAAEQGDARYAREQEAWIDRGPQEGIPSATAHVPEDIPGRHPDRFGNGAPEDPRHGLVESSDGLLVICTGADDPASWIAAGESLSALWLAATRDGLSVVPLSHVIEVEETRLALQHDVFAAMAVPHLLVRIGWQQIGRDSLEPTPRRPVADLLR